MEFLQSIDWMQMLKCFVVGGLICIIGQILIDKTKLTPARILVIFVTTGAIQEVKWAGLLGAFTGGVKASAGGIAAAIFFGYIASLIAKPKIKKQ